MRSLKMYLYRISCFLLFLLFVSSCKVQAAEDWLPRAYDKTIVVGLRDDSRPFSYASSAKSGEDVLKGYGGYMVEICRRVLSTMVNDFDGPFAGYKVIPRPVKATERFSDLKSARIDILCGPNSITMERLKDFNVSLPLFLSGITYVRVKDHMLPRTKSDCRAIIGLLANTTAQTDGLREISERGLLSIYDSVVEQFLALPVSDDSGISSVETIQRLGVRIKKYVEGDIGSGQSSGDNAVENQSSIKVPSCTDGYKTGPGPVVVYETHKEGIEDLCNGGVLFYVGDIDILRSRINSNRNCDDKQDLHHETLTSEAYAVYFFRSDRIGYRARPQQSLLFTEFNNELMQKLQRIEGILDYEFSREFRDTPPSEELSRFFAAYQFIKDQ